MIHILESRPRPVATLLLLTLSLAACGDKPPERPAPPETVAPAPAVTVAPAEDRGHENSAPAPEADGAFGNVESGEAERAASERGHQSAGDRAPATQPGSAP
jgi:hypothetical protein